VLNFLFAFNKKHILLAKRVTASMECRVSSRDDGRVSFVPFRIVPQLQNKLSFCFINTYGLIAISTHIENYYILCIYACINIYMCACVYICVRRKINDFFLGFGVQVAAPNTKLRDE
jgi:hypothetical protein